jgi:hypothetical protein
MNEYGASAELPRYKCHKQVWTLKIAGIEKHQGVGEATITPVDTTYSPLRVSADYVIRHKPEVGGYYVVYDDGYQSFSPAKAFEEGYSRV